MTTDQMDEQIRAAQVQIEKLRSTLHPLKMQFLAEYKTFFAEWILPMVTYIGKGDPQASEQLGKEGISKLRSEVQQYIVGRMPNRVDLLVADKSHWEENVLPQRDREKNFEGALIRLTADVGEILVRYKFLRSTTYGLDRGRWETQTVSVMGENGRSVASFLGYTTVPMSASLTEKRNKYFQIVREISDLENKVSDLTAAVRQSKVDALWDEE